MIDYVWRIIVIVLAVACLTFGFVGAVTLVNPTLETYAPRVAGVAEESCIQICTPVCVVTCTPVVNLTPTTDPTATRTTMPSATPTAEMTPSPRPTPLDGIQTSEKKGIAVEVLAFDTVEQGLALLGNTGASWWYNWTLGTKEDWQIAAQGKEYVPMIRKAIEQQKARIRAIIEGGYRGLYWLIGNEPNTWSQDHLTWAQAADVYGKAVYYVQGIDPTAKFILLGLVEPSSWWERGFTAAWITRWGKSPPVTGYHLHIYPVARGDKTAEQVQVELINNMKGWIREHPGKELWITEFGRLDTQNLQTIADTMIRVGNICEETPGVTRYAYFLLGSARGDWGPQALYSRTPVWPTETDLLGYYQQVPMPDWRNLLPVGVLRLGE